MVRTDQYGRSTHCTGSCSCDIPERWRTRGIRHQAFLPTEAAALSALAPSYARRGSEHVAQRSARLCRGSMFAFERERVRGTFERSHEHRRVCVGFRRRRPKPDVGVDDWRSPPYERVHTDRQKRGERATRRRDDPLWAEGGDRGEPATSSPWGRLQAEGTGLSDAEGVVHFTRGRVDSHSRGVRGPAGGEPPAGSLRSTTRVERRSGSAAA